MFKRMLGVAIAVGACGHGAPPVPATPAAPPAVPAAAQAPCAAITEPMDGGDPLHLGLEACTTPDGDATLVRVRRAADGAVLWSDRGDLVSAYLVPNHTEPSLHVVLATDDQATVIVLEVHDRALTEVDRFQDSGD
jgi:hypothetical protein